MLGLFVLCLLFFCMILYDAQVVHREDYYARSASQVTDTESVESSRGIITDTNGKVLVSNKEIYTITLDLDLIPDVEGQERGVTVSRAILRLLELCEDQGSSMDRHPAHHLHRALCPTPPPPPAAPIAPGLKTTLRSASGPIRFLPPRTPIPG